MSSNISKVSWYNPIVVNRFAFCNLTSFKRLFSFVSIAISQLLSIYFNAESQIYDLYSSISFVESLYLSSNVTLTGALTRYI